MDIENQFDICVGKLGGYRVNMLVGESPDFDDADYIFPQYQFIAELKSLEEDKIIAKNTVNKASEIYCRYLSEQKAPNLGSGRIRFTTTDEYPDEFKRELCELYRRSIHNAIKKANKQIKLTKENLNMQDHQGLLILVNNGHTALTPETLLFIVRETFERNTFGSIDVLLYFTVEPKSEHPDIPEDFLVWLPLEIRPLKIWRSEFSNRLQKAWFNRMANISGESVRVYSVNEEFDISDIKNN